MHGFIHFGGAIYQMVKITKAEMDILIKRDGNWWNLPYRFDRRKRVWPKPPEKSEVFFYDN